LEIAKHPRSLCKIPVKQRIKWLEEIAIQRCEREGHGEGAMAKELEKKTKEIAWVNG
jgi:hypothetical protein